MQLNSAVINQIKDAFDSCVEGVGTYELVVEPNGSLLATLADWPIEPLMYFSRPNQTVQYVGIGAWCMMTNSEARLFLKAHENDNVHLFGGNAFNKAIKSSEWQSECWVLPMCMIIQTTTESVLRFIFDKRKKENTWAHLVNVLQKMKDTPLTECKKQPYISLDHHPNKTEWERTIQGVKKEMADNELKKVVLARETWVNFTETVNPFLIINHIQNNDPQLFHFVVKFSGKGAFIGGTPERLFELTGHQLESEAIAGTVKKDRGNASLLKQKKETDEHQYVADYIMRALAEICLDPIEKSQEPSILELKYLYHLIQEFNGTLKPGIGPIETLTVLHPTPAVAGTPTVLAMNMIEKKEPFSRHWYAGPIGMISAKKSIVVVAIRSGMVARNQVTLYAGAGIIEASNPESEWQELDAKIVGFTEVFKPK